MARKDILPGISFFSFQDIITSLTGIMFLIVLLLVILLAERCPEVAAAPDPAIAEMQIRIAENTAEMQMLRKVSRQNRLLLKELEKLDLDTVEMRGSQIRREIERLQISLGKIRTEIMEKSAAAENCRRCSRNLKADIRELQEIRKRQEAELQQLKDSRKHMEKRFGKYRRIACMAVENRTGLNPVLIECRKDGIRLLEIRSGKVTDLRNAGPGMPERIAALKNTLRDRDRNREYYTFLVSPEAFEYAALSGDDLGIREDRRGLEFYPDDRTTVFAEEEP